MSDNLESQGMLYSTHKNAQFLNKNQGFYGLDGSDRMRNLQKMRQG